MKVCNKCGVEKPLSEYYFRRDRNRYEGYCKSCKATLDLNSRRRREENLEYLEEQRRIGREKARNLSRTVKDHKNTVTREKRMAKRKIELIHFYETYGFTYKEHQEWVLLESFLRRSRKHHGYKYDYSHVKISKTTDEVKIICPDHGGFYSSANNHSKGQGCYLCGKESVGGKLRLTEEEAIKTMKNSKPNPEDFIFDRVVYKDYKTKVEIGCKHHGYFKMSLATFTKSVAGCPTCGNNGFNKMKSGWLYILTNKDITKIGITNRKPIERAKAVNKSSGLNFKVHSSYFYENGEDAYNKEQEILKEFRKTYEQPQNRFDGSTECFIGVDIGKLIKRIEYND